ncbi:MAG TPA: CHAT domain-containing protein [Bryobacteraceae bacterium]|nr:CHAT domain-containing protein [Bryobacteraceae bacterium]
MSVKLPILDISLRKRDAQGYEASFRFADPLSKVDELEVSACGTLSPAQFLRREQDASETGSYGIQLSRALLGTEAIKSKFVHWQTAATGRPIRVRLFIEPSAPELHPLRWEALSDPVSGDALFGGDRMYFSRFLSSSDYRDVHLRARGDLKALAVIANPSDLNDAIVTLAPVDVADEHARAKAALGPSIPLTPDQPPAAPGTATLDWLCDQMRAQSYDILYLVCHGAISQPEGVDEPVLWLESSDGKSAVTTATTLVRELKKLPDLPRLVVLASCQSGGTGRTADVDGTMTALAPRLAAAGIPAVVAMQGNICMDTIARFMPAFFNSLHCDGLVDRAMSIARGKIGTQDDYWAPVLYSRLRDGCVWYTPGFGEGYQRFPALLTGIRLGKCVPILGSGMTEHVFGSARRVARTFAEGNNFPLGPDQKDNLPTVTQYLATPPGTPDLMKDGLWSHLSKALLDRHGARLDPALEGQPLSCQVKAAGAMLRKLDPAEPHTVLASQPFPLYLTTNFDTLLEDALAEQGKKPRIEYCRWNKLAEDPPRELLSEREPGYVPDARNPLVFHLFGYWEVDDSLVLTEDDYFDYLIGVTRQSNLIPPLVRKAMAKAARLLLGFRIDEWSFRVLFRSLMSQEGAELAVGQPHLSAQIGPEEDRTLDAEAARQYFHNYFATSQIDVYWGSVGDFVRELMRQKGAAHA